MEQAETTSRKAPACAICHKVAPVSGLHYDRRAVLKGEVVCASWSAFQPCPFEAGAEWVAFNDGAVFCPECWASAQAQAHEAAAEANGWGDAPPSS